MAQGKPPPRHGPPDYNRPPEAQDLERDDPRVDEFEPPRNRNVSAISVLVTVLVVLLLAVGYFLTRS